MGNSISSYFNYSLSDKVSLIASTKTWIEGGAIQQLQHAANMHGMQRVVGLPDLHPGRGYPIGAAFLTREVIYPALIGGDIGCGMRLCITDLIARKNSAERLQKRLGNIDGALADESAYWHEQIADSGFRDTGFADALGTIGGGNHFAEIQTIDQVMDVKRCEVLGLDTNYLCLLVHSGSRGFGGDVLRQHIERFQHHGLPADSEAAAHYFEQHQRALAYAELNRSLIQERMLERLHASGQVILDIHHNFMQKVIDGENTSYLHRKGAAPADRGPIVIPGSRGDYSFLVEPISTEEKVGAHLSLLSLAHGAGRKWQRSECHGRLANRFTQDQLRRTRFGSHVVCADKHLLYEEAPEAYKPIDSVIEVLCESGLIRVLARLKPVLSYKTAGGCC